MTIILMTVSFVGGYAFCWKQDAVVAFVNEKVAKWFKRS